MMSSRRPPSLLAHTSYLASQVSKYGRRQLESALAEHGMALGHHAVLSALDDFGPQSQQQLADSLDLDKSHLVGRLDKLVDGGFVSRLQNPTDRRRNEISLTHAGKSLVDRLRPIGLKSQEGCLTVLSQAERDTLAELLLRILVANDATGTPSPDSLR